MSAEMIVNILDHQKSRAEGIAQLLNSVGLSSSVHQNPGEFLSQVDPSAIGCLLLDVRMPRISGLHVQAELKKRHSLLSVIFLTECHDIDVAVEALKNGASEFITEPYSEQKLIDSVFAALEMSKRQQHRLKELAEIESCVQNLTKREKQILDFVAAGFINKVISVKLHISSKTVEMHRANIMKKMHAKSLAHLIKMHTLYELSRTELV